MHIDGSDGVALEVLAFLGEDSVRFLRLSIIHA
jgi:hypothetical protein